MSDWHNVLLGLFAVGDSGKVVCIATGHSINNLIRVSKQYVYEDRMFIAAYFGDFFKAY